jgi:hypothetical protein
MKKNDCTCYDIYLQKWDCNVKRMPSGCDAKGAMQKRVSKRKEQQCNRLLWPATPGGVHNFSACPEKI